MSDGWVLGTVPLSGSLRNALNAIDASALEIALVTDEAGHLLGVLTDGDIRRALLKGVPLDGPIEPHMRRSYARVDPHADRASVLDLMRAMAISQIPIIDSNGKLAGLHTLRGVLGAVSRPHCAVIMAGGRGERLRPETDDVPKPMLKVAGRPILERIVLHLVGFGIRTIFIAVNYRANVIESHFQNGSPFGCEIKYLRETEFLGTGGALSLLPPLAEQHPLLVVNGDLLTQVNVGNLLAFHEHGSFRATVGVHEYAHSIPLGVVELDGEQVIGFREKPTEVWPVNAGIYVIDADLVRRVPPETHYSLPALIDGCLERGERVGAFRVSEDWMDVGRRSELTRARGIDPR